MSFKDLHLAAPLLSALKDEGYSTPTPIQAKAIPAILEGRDVLGCAQTGTGKTAAFALPILHRLLSMPVDKTRRGPALPRALILAPTRELAEQIGESFATYGRHTGLVHTCIYGGVSQFHQVRALHRGVDILVATPGRLEDLMEQQIVTLKDVRVLVLDEADRMLDMGFIQPIRRIAAAVPVTPERPRHTLLFSATMPKEIMHLADSLLKDPVKVAVTPVASAAPLITQSLYLVQKSDKQSLLHHLLADREVRRAVVFTKTKFGADRVSKRLRKAGVTAGEIHGNKAQNQRLRALDAFRDGRMRVLVATDVAARGLDVDGITHVFNFDLPMEPESYVHRIGRTGRAGATGIAVSFCDGSERGLLKDIERLTGKKIPVVPTPTDMEHVDGTPEPIESFRPGQSVQPARKPLNKKGSNKVHAAGHAHADGHHKPKDAPAHHHTPKPAHAERKHADAGRAAAHPDRSAHPADSAHRAPAEPAPRASHAGMSLTDPIKPKPAKTPHDHPAYMSMVEGEAGRGAPAPRREERAEERRGFVLAGKGGFKGGFKGGSNSGFKPGSQSGSRPGSGPGGHPAKRAHGEAPHRSAKPAPFARDERFDGFDGGKAAKVAKMAKVAKGGGFGHVDKSAHGRHAAASPRPGGASDRPHSARPGAGVKSAHAGKPGHPMKSAARAGSAGGSAPAPRSGGGWKPGGPNGKRPAHAGFGPSGGHGHPKAGSKRSRPWR